MVKRLQIDISTESFERLTALKKSTDAGSYGDVTQRAYKLLEFFSNAVQDGKRIQVVSPDGEVTEVQLL